MSNMSLFGVLFLTLIIFIFASLKIRNEKLSILKFVSLVFLPSTLRVLLPLVFFICIVFIIYLADTADHNFAFRLIGNIPYGDKLMHAVLYGVMALFLNFGLKYKSYKFLGFNMQLGAIIVLVFATLEEISQDWLPSRTFDLLDVLADFVGVILLSFLRSK